VVLEGYCVDDDYGVGSVRSRWGTEEYAIDGLVGVFEGVKDEFGVGEVFETKVWVGHSVNGG
jgi:hypothetical protein